MLLLSLETIADINYITGYITADVFIELWKNECGDYDELFREYVIYLFEHKKLITLISSGNNTSFMDYFIRRCMEDYIYRTKPKLIEMYSIFDTQISTTYEVYLRKKYLIKGTFETPIPTTALFLSLILS